MVNDTDADGDTLSITAVGNAVGGTVALVAGQVVFTPTSGFSGPASFTYDISDGNSGTDTASVSLTVDAAGNTAPIAVDDSFSSGFGETLTVTVGEGLLANDSDPDFDPISVVGFQEAANGELSVFADGSFTYTPDTGFSGTETILYTISDGFAVATATLSIVVEANGTPVAVDDDYTTGFGDDLTVGAGEGLLANDSDPDFDPISVVGFQEAANGELSVFADGSFTYAPDAGFSGTETILYTISDGFAVATATLSIVVEANGTPVAVDDDYTTGFGDDLTVGAGEGLLANDSDPDFDPISVVGFQEAANGELSVFADGSFTYAPDAGFSGTETILYTISDGFAVATATLSIVVEANGTPVAVDDDYTTGFGDDLTVGAGEGLLVNDSDPDFDPISVVGFQEAANGELSIFADGSFTYTPDTGFSGTETILYTISDGFAVATATLTIEVAAPGNTPPNANADSYAVDEDGVLSVSVAAGVLANDSDVDGDPLTVSLLTGPANGSLTLNADGSFDYTPNANFNGIDSFTYEVSDGNGGTATATASITVNAVNDDPTAVADSGFATPFETALSIDPAALLANDTDVEGDTLSLTAVGNAVGGTVALIAGQVVFTPTSGFSGPASFTYDISDGNGGTDTGSVGLTVQGGGGLTGIIGTAGDDIFNARTTAPGQALPTSAAEVIHGLGGNDRIDGVGGADTMYGGAGDDVYFLRSVGAIASEIDPLTGLDSGGNDRVFSFVDAVLGSFVENLTLSGTAVSGTGNTLDNVLYGNAQDNVLVGLDGNDVLNGLVGADTMEGGDGDDVYFVDDLGDVVVELPGQGDDRVNSAVDYTLTDGVERLNLIRTAISGTGNDLDNIMLGNAEDNILDGSSGNDRIFGNAGNDTIIGGEGADTVVGGAGSDMFVFNSISDAGDRLNDFASGVDKIALDLAGFVDLAGLALADAFIFGSQALDSDDRLIYDQSNFTLYYDADGAGGADQTLLANLNYGATLLHTDFMLT